MSLIKGGKCWGVWTGGGRVRAANSVTDRNVKAMKMSVKEVETGAENKTSVMVLALLIYTAETTAGIRMQMEIVSILLPGCNN